jgi:hypothetical protein
MVSPVSEMGCDFFPLLASSTGFFWEKKSWTGVCALLLDHVPLILNKASVSLAF